MTRVTAIVFSLVLWHGALAVSAQPRSADPAAYNSPQYKELVQRALQEYDLGHWSEARVFFAKAHELAPNARTLRGLALVSYESRRYVDTIRFGEQALTNQVQPLTPTLRGQLQQFVEQARSFVAHARIVTKPADAELRIDGVTAARGEDGALALDAGTHELVVTAAGYDAQTRTLNVEGGSDVRFDIALTREVVAAAEPQSEPSSQAEVPAAHGGGSVGPWIVIGVSAAVAVGGGVLLALGAADKAKVENAPQNTPWREVESAYERAPTFLNVGWALAGVGVAGLAAGLTWKLLATDDGREHVTLRLSPTDLKVSGHF